MAWNDEPPPLPEPWPTSPGGTIFTKDAPRSTLIAQLIDARLEIARHEGYIARVKEMDRGAQRVEVSDPAGITEDHILGRIETKLRNTPGEDFERVISGLSTEEIDLILKTADKPRQFRR